MFRTYHIHHDQGQHITRDMRVPIETVYNRNLRQPKKGHLSLRQLARKLGLPKSTLHDEIRRGKVLCPNTFKGKDIGDYSSEIAQQAIDAGHLNKGRPMKMNTTMAKLLRRRREQIRLFFASRRPPVFPLPSPPVLLSSPPTSNRTGPPPAPNPERNTPMKKFVCPICGYVHEGDSAPEKCPQCGCPGAKFLVKETEGKMTWACEHEIGVAKGLDPEVVKGLEMNFAGECTEVGMYLAMSRQAEREGYPEIADAFKRYAFEEAEHAAKFAELLGDVVTNSTKKNLELRAAAEQGACAGKLDLAKRAKELNYDAVHDTVHEMAKDEARHGAGFEGLLKRYFA